MSRDAIKQSWEQYCAEELAAITPALTTLGYTLDPVQPHLGGERYLMQAVTTESGKKLILLGTRVQDGRRAVLKVAREEAGKRELTHERVCRDMLPNLGFAYAVFKTPEELYFGEQAGRLISIQAFIDQESTFLARPIENQFALALTAFKAQEGAHATTSGHERSVLTTYGVRTTEEYLESFAHFVTRIRQVLGTDTPEALLTQATGALSQGKEYIEQYGSFLTHTDFVPHNFRVHDGDLYLLDASSLRFGNKYEGWARFTNFMALYNPPMVEALHTYVKSNRTAEESHAFTLMRLYRLGEIIWYYARSLDTCEGNLHELNSERIKLWTRVLEAVLAEEPVPEAYLVAYKKRRDTLRSADEKARQVGLH